MSYPTLAHLQQTMGDQGGLFCAHCLEYIDRNGVEGKALSRHHVFRTSDVKGEFGHGYCNGYWIPAHRECHEKHLDPWGVEVWKTVERFESLRLPEQMRTTSAMHERGNYGGALLGNSLLLRKRSAELDEVARQQLLAFAHSSSSGVRWAQLLVAELPVPKWELCEPGLLYSMANERSVRGKQRQSRSLLDLAARKQRGLGWRGRRRFAAMSHRRLATYVENLSEASPAQISEAFSATKTAAALAENSYTHNTALMSRACLLHSVDRPAQGCELVAPLGDNPSVSLFYRARVWWCEGILLLNLGERAEDVYKKLVAAMYTMDFLGHQPQMRILVTKPMYGYGPGYALMNAPELSVERLGGRDRMLELRREMILSEIWSGVRACVQFT